jgi:hypothetical protein
VNLLALAPSIVLLFDAILAPSIGEAAEIYVELDVVLDVSRLPELLGGVPWVVVGDELSELGSNRALGLGRQALTGDEGRDCAQNNEGSCQLHINKCYYIISLILRIW